MSDLSHSSKNLYTPENEIRGDGDMRKRNITTATGQNNNSQPLKGSDNKGHSRDGGEDEAEFLFWALFFRIPIFIFWIGTLLYSTWHVFLAAEEYLEWQRDPVMNPGPFTSLLNRGRDILDYEWHMFTQSLFFTIIIWYSFYLIVSRLTQHYFPERLPTISASLSYVFMTNLMGTWPATFIFLLPLMYWIIIGLHRKYLVWPFTMAYLIFMNSALCMMIVPISKELTGFYFFVTAAWTVARCVSFSFDTWNRHNKWNLTSLCTSYKYVFYFPLTVNGPLVLYTEYEHHILNRAAPKTKDETINEVKTLLRKFSKLGLYILGSELLLHYLYFRPLSLTTPALFRVNIWALCGVVYWLGQFFQLKYYIMYGIPSAIAEFEGLPMPPLPKCIAYIHRYSALWKDFDRGLYNFLVRYTYLPSMELIAQLDSKNRISVDLRKLAASFASFVYVFVWHSTQFEVFVWAALNFLGITIERIGSYIKRKIDSRCHVPSYWWDVIVEPILTIPLAMMSVLNSAVFCGNLNVALVVNKRIWNESHYIPHFFLCFTTVGVTVRTWRQKYPIIQEYCLRKYGVTLPSIGLRPKQ